MMIHELTAEAGPHKRRKRVGRGESSGHGKTCCRGYKGAQSRAGYTPHPLFEGGGLPLFRRIPKRGFSNFHFRTDYAPVNLADLEAFSAGDKVNLAGLKARNLVDGRAERVKILGDGALSKKLTLEVDAVSETAKAAIEKAGGTIQLIQRPDHAAVAKAKRGAAKDRRAARSELSARAAKRKARKG